MDNALVCFGVCVYWNPSPNQFLFITATPPHCTPNSSLQRRYCWQHEIRALSVKGVQRHPPTQLLEPHPLTPLNCWYLSARAFLLWSYSFSNPPPPRALLFQASCRSLLLKGRHCTLYTHSMWSCHVGLVGLQATWGQRPYRIHWYPQSTALCLVHSRHPVVEMEVMTLEY